MPPVLSGWWVSKPLTVSKRKCKREHNIGKQAWESETPMNTSVVIFTMKERIKCDIANKNPLAVEVCDLLKPQSIPFSCPLLFLFLELT